jgi:hypothetical protein
VAEQAGVAPAAGRGDGGGDGRPLLWRRMLAMGWLLLAADCMLIAACAAPLLLLCWAAG